MSKLLKYFFVALTVVIVSSIFIVNAADAEKLTRTSHSQAR